MRRELGCADHAARVGVEAVVQADEVRPRRAVRRGVGTSRTPSAAASAGSARGEKAMISHAPGLHQARELAAAGAEPDDAEHLAGQVDAHRLRLQVPAAACGRALCCSARRLASARISRNAEDAVAWVSVSGALKTATSLAVQAARSILSMPAPARPITVRRSAPSAKAAAFTHGRKMTIAFALRDVRRRDLQRVEPVPVAGVAGLRALVAQKAVGG